jgi:hypothetical protein
MQVIVEGKVQVQHNSSRPARDDALDVEIKRKRAEVQRYELETDIIQKRFKAEEEQRLFNNSIEAKRIDIEAKRVEKDEMIASAFLAFAQVMKEAMNKK